MVLFFAVIKPNRGRHVDPAVPINFGQFQKGRSGNSAGRRVRVGRGTMHLSCTYSENIDDSDTTGRLFLPVFNRRGERKFRGTGGNRRGGKRRFSARCTPASPGARASGRIKCPRPLCFGSLS